MSSENKVIYIKNMVCPRCITAVRQTFEKLGIGVQEIELGRAVIDDDHDVLDEKLQEALREKGFALIGDRNIETVEQVKASLIAYVQNLEKWDEAPKVSDYLAEKLYQNYAALSSTFSQTEDITIEKYLIRLKIERVKELLSYGESTLSEIALRLKYSSTPHLSSQFKDVTGMSPTDFKKARNSFRKSLDQV